MRMRYKEAERFLLSLSNLPFHEDRRKYRRQSIIRIRRLLSLLGNPEHRIPHVIHVAGTSGKGSVATYLASILAADGRRTGLIISPHPTMLRERWQVNHRIMSKKQFIRIMERLKVGLDRYAVRFPEDPLSFFELVTAIGFLFFADTHVAWAVVEVGMGGRYDATNVFLKKDVSVITTIGRDHEETLGSISDIAREKAGIITPGCAVFTGAIEKTLLAIVHAEARRKHALIVQPSANNIPLPQLQPLGEHQKDNARLAVAVATFVGVPPRTIERGLASAVQPLRMEVVSRRPLIILDGAHNPDKIKTTIETIKQEIRKSKGRELHMIVGFSADKHIDAIIKQLASLSPTSVICARNTINPFRKVAHPGIIARKFKKLLSSASIIVRLLPADAFRDAKKLMKKRDILLVTGSIFLSGEIRGFLTGTE